MRWEGVGGGGGRRQAGNPQLRQKQAAGVQRQAATLTLAQGRRLKPHANVVAAATATDADAAAGAPTEAAAAFHRQHLSHPPAIVQEALRYSSGTAAVRQCGRTVSGLALEAWVLGLSPAGRPLYRHTLAHTHKHTELAAQAHQIPPAAQPLPTSIGCPGW